jgi:hypothetical protein
MYLIREMCIFRLKCERCVTVANLKNEVFYQIALKNIGIFCSIHDIMSVMFIFFIFEGKFQIYILHFTSLLPCYQQILLITP